MKTKGKDVRLMMDGIFIIHGEKLWGRNFDGVGFIVHSLVFHLADSHKIRSPRSVIFRLHPLRQKTISIIICYLLTSAADEREVDAFHEELEEAMYNKKSFNKFVLGDYIEKIEMEGKADRRI